MSCHIKSVGQRVGSHPKGSYFLRLALFPSPGEIGFWEGSPLFLSFFFPPFLHFLSFCFAPFFPSFAVWPNVVTNFFRMVP